MKTIAVIILLAVSVLSGLQGYIYSEFDACIKRTEQQFYKKEFSLALAAIKELRDNRWYRTMKTYSSLDILGIDKKLDYQLGRILLGQGNLKEAYAAFEQCTTAESAELASYCLYQQGNTALYQGNINTAEKKWQDSMAKSIGGHDFDAQVNLELLKNDKKKTDAVAVINMLNHRRSSGPSFFLRPPSQKSGSVKP